MNIFRKITANQFLWGLVFGAIFSLVVNVITVQIQETIQRQRVFEALENEILYNGIQAEVTIRENANVFDVKGKTIDYYHNFFKYSDNVWKSNEFLKYGLSLDPGTQAKIYSYYAAAVSRNNEIMNKNDRLMQFQLGGCYLNDGGLKQVSNSQCIHAFNYFTLLESQAAKRVFDAGFEVLKIFHPTKDRMSNPILKFFMGDKSLGILSKGAVR